MSPRARLLWRYHRRELATLALVALLILIPWLVGLGAGIWYLVHHGWGWTWWAATVLLLALAFLLLHRWPRRRAPAAHPLLAPDPGASTAEQQARQALQQRAADLETTGFDTLDALPELVRGAFHDVAQAYSPDDPNALWRFTLPELLLMVEDFSQRLRGTVLADFPVLQHLELSWVVTLSELRGPAGKLLSLYRMVQWINPGSALAAELRNRVTGKALEQVGDTAKVQLGVLLIEQAGETAIRLYSGGYRRRAEEALPTAPRARPDTPPEPLTLVLAGQRNAGKSALLNALLGRAREPVGLLTASAQGCRAYEFQSKGAGPLVLVDCPGAEGGDPAKSPWLAQAARGDLVLWVAAANRADRAVDQRALDALAGLAKGRRTLRPVPRILVLTHADRLDPPLEWAPPYDIGNGQRPKERHMRAARQAACEQLGVAPAHCALIAVRPGEPVWNAQALEDAILAVLPEAQQKQLERGMAKDGWFARTRDTVLTMPGVSGGVRRIGGPLLRRALRRVTGKAPRGSS